MMQIHITDNGSIQLGDFDAVRAFKIARKLEQDGIGFYTAVRKKLSDKKVVFAIDHLLDSEKEHLAFFQNKLDSVQSDADGQFEEDDFVDYMDSGIFALTTDKDSLSETITDPIKVIELGIAIEKNSINFYQALLLNTPDEDGRKSLSEIIEEEKKHLETFSRLM
jgi:rubrerythrin